MFGLNAKDALGAMEDIAILRNAAAEGNRRIAAANASEDEKMAATFRHLDNRLEEYFQKNEALKEEIRMLNEASAEVVAVANATNRALVEVVEELASQTGVPVSTVAQRFCREARTRHYDSVVDEFLAAGTLKTDPRSTAVVKKRGWYLSGKPTISRERSNFEP